MDTKKEYSYEEIIALALAKGITDNIVNIGTWARFQGFSKRVVQRKKKRYAVYTKNNENV